MVKTYLRYQQQDVFGLISASTSPDLVLLPGPAGRTALVPCLESLQIWQVKQGVLLDVLSDPGNRAAVTAVALDPQGRHVAAGYEDGRIRIWDLRSHEVSVVFNAHTAAVTALVYNASGALLASGSRDTDVVLWDVVAEQGVCRLKGHKDEVTDLRFVEARINIVPDADFTSPIAAAAGPGLAPPAAESHRDLSLLVSSSKDTFLKVWDTTLQHCVHTLTGHRNEVWSFDICARQCDQYALIVAGSTDKTLRTWRLYTTLFAPASAPSEELSSLFERVGVEYSGSLDRPGGKKRVRRVRFDRVLTPSAAATAAAAASATTNAPVVAGTDAWYPVNAPFESKTLVVLGLDKAVDLFALRGRPERSRRAARRLKRYRDKLKDVESGKDKSGLAVETPPAYLPSDDLETQVPVRTEGRVAAVTFMPAPAGAGNTPAAAAAAAAAAVVKKAHLLVALSDNSLQSWSAPMVPLTITHSEEGSGATTGMVSAAVAAAAANARLEIHHTVALPGHRGGVRALALASDDSLLLSAAGAQIKLWNMATRNCIRTLDLVELDSASAAAARSASGAVAGSAAIDGEDDEGEDTVLSAVFVPGNRHVLVGTKRGLIDLYELASGQLLHRERAHDGAPVWTLDLRADQRGFASGGGKEVWGWEFELVEVPGAVQGTGAKGKRLSFAQTRALKVSDDVLCVKHSPDGRYIAVGLLDATVRVFHSDTLAFFVSLYGHKLPVLSIDFSSDSTLILTGSADKTVKMWGSDFGDLRKSFRAHDGSVMRVQWVPKTHFFFTVGKDKLVKYWDGDRSTEIMSLAGHHAEVWALAVASKGQFVVSTGNDRSLRLWVQTEQPISPEEERERKMEEQFEADTRAAGVVAGSEKVGAVAGGVSGPGGDSAAAWKGVPTSKEALELGEQIIRALDVCAQEEENWKRYHDLVRVRVTEWRERRRIAAGSGRGAGLAALLSATATLGRDGVNVLGADASERAELTAIVEAVPKPAPHPLLLGATLSQYVLRVLRSVRLYELTETLLTLPYEYALRLLSFLGKLLEQGNEVELCVKCTLTLLRVHNAQIISTKAAVSTLAALRRYTRLRLLAMKDTIGVNMAGLRVLAADIEARSTQNYFGEPEEALAQRKRKAYDTVAARRKNGHGIKKFRGMRSQ